MRLPAPRNSVWPERRLSLLPPCAVLFLRARFLKHPPFPCLLRHTNTQWGRARCVGSAWVCTEYPPCWAEQGGWDFPDKEHRWVQALSWAAYYKQTPANRVSYGPRLAWACRVGGGLTQGALLGAGRQWTPHRGWWWWLSLAAWKQEVCHPHFDMFCLQNLLLPGVILVLEFDAKSSFTFFCFSFCTSLVL